MKRRKQIGKLIYTPRWGQGDVELSEDYDGLSREEKLDVLSYWISDLLSIRNEMITNPKSWHHFTGEKSWYGLTDGEVDEIYTSVQEDVNEHWNKGGTTTMFPLTLYKAFESKLKDKNNA